MTALAAAPAVQTTAPSTVALEDLTWTELRDAVRAGKTTVIIPIGGTEQNGPHMTLGKHNRRVKALATQIAQALGNALVAPVVAYVPEGNVSPPTSHMRFPGTITIPDAAYDKLLESAARSFRQAGFRDIVLLGDHGGYRKLNRATAQRLNKEWANGPTRVHAVEEYYDAVDKAYPEALRQRGFTEAEIGTHAGLADTSLAMAIDPALVRPERLQPGAVGGANEGVYGDPRRSSADLGRIGVDLVVKRTVEAIRAATARQR